MKSKIEANKDTARRLEDFSKHLQGVMSQVRSQYGEQSEHHRRLRKFAESEQAISRRVVTADETNWQQIKSAVDQDLHTLLGEFDKWVEGIDQKYRR